MKLGSSRTARFTGLACALAAILIVLAILQVRWTGQVSQADAERMQANLHTAVTRLRRDFHLQLLRICWAFQSPATGVTPRALKFYADRYDDWIGASARPDMISAMLAWDKRNDRLLRLDPATAKFNPASWPRELASLRANVENASCAPVGEDAGAPNAQGWMLDEKSHALFHPFYAAAAGDALSCQGGVIIDLNMRFIWRTLLPELNARYFRGPSGSDYRVWIINGDDLDQVFYQSLPVPSEAAVRTGDVDEDFLGGGRNGIAGIPAERELAAEKTALSPELTEEIPVEGALRAAGRLPSLTIFDASAWRLVVRHRSGSVESAVESLRRRNLTISFSVLLLLAASVALILISAQRAQRFAKLQLDFVAGVSHELRTPLAVIRSASENLADGVVAAPDQVRKYGALLRDEGQRLSDMVGQVLGFAANQAGPRASQKRALDAAELIESTLADSAPILDSERITVERRFARDIPPVLGDPLALRRCLQNLISNAVKYRGESRWIGIRTERSRNGVDIVVEDRGAGIHPADLPHIFEPFYRGRNGAAAHIHGTGLGLSLAKDIAEAMGGRLAAKSAPGKGSQFTLHLPAAATARKAASQTTSEQRGPTA